MKQIILVIKNFDYKKLIFPILVIIFYLLGFGYCFYLYLGLKDNYEKDSSILKNEEVLTITMTQTDIVEVEKIFVDIKGSVNKPGVYELEKGKRVIDAIGISGGLKKNANTRFINLSKELNDGDVIVIYSNEEIEKANENKTIIVETPCVCEEVKNDVCIKEDDNKEEDNINAESKLININLASKDELMQLNGIGESKANAIIEYRNNNGNFKNINDITNVSGISENIFEKIKTNITV